MTRLKVWPLANRRRGVPAWLATLALAVLLGPWLGALHQIVHLRPAHSELHEAAAFHGVFGQHGSQADCLAYDQLSHGDALPSAAVCLPPVACPATTVWTCLAAPARHAFTAFLSRAPPPWFD